MMLEEYGWLRGSGLRNVEGNSGKRDGNSE